MAEIVNGMFSESVKKATGKTWDEWIVILDKEMLFQKPHKEIAKFVNDNYLKSGWWSQMVTVGYEKAKGLRIDSQNSGGFQVGASKTVPVPINILYSFWEDGKKRKQWLSEKFTITKATKDKSMRIKWSDGKTRVDVGFYSKGEGKSQVAVGHEKIPTQKQAKEIQAFWREKLVKLLKQVQNEI